MAYSDGARLHRPLIVCSTSRLHHATAHLRSTRSIHCATGCSVCFELCSRDPQAQAQAVDWSRVTSRALAEWPAFDSEDMRA